MREYEQVDKQVINKVSNYDTPNFFLVIKLGHTILQLCATLMSGNFWGSIKGAKYHFALQDRTWDYS